MFASCCVVCSAYGFRTQILMGALKVRAISFCFVYICHCNYNRNKIKAAEPGGENMEILLVKIWQQAHSRQYNGFIAIRHPFAQQREALANAKTI